MDEARPPPYNAEIPTPIRVVDHQTSRPLPPEPASTNQRLTPDSDLPSTNKSSLDLTQRLERKLAEYNASENVFKRWLFEILSWVVSALCMGAIIGIYIWLNDAPMSQVSNHLTYTNVLGKVASAALIVPTSEALGQLKWHWFRKSNAIWDFEIFDKASRGPIGATLLLFRTKGRSLAALGALLIVLLLAIDTFFQQVVEFPDRWALLPTSGAIPRVVRYEPVYPLEMRHGWEEDQCDKELYQVMNGFFYGNGTQPVPFGNGTRPDIPLSCPTSNCTWPMYETLAVCSSCVDVSDSLDLTFACVNATIDWTSTWSNSPRDDAPYPTGPVCGYFLNATSATPIMLSGYALSDNATNHTADEALLVRALPLTEFLTKKRLYDVGSIHFKSIRNPIMDFLVASAPDGSQSIYKRQPPVIQECLLSWCVQKIKSSYEYGEYHEAVEARYQNTSNGPSPWYAFKIPKDQGGGYWLEYTENITITPPVSRLDESQKIVANDAYGATNASAYGVTCPIDDFMPSVYTSLGHPGVSLLRYKEYDDGASTRVLPFNPWLPPNNITKHMERLATAMTNTIRSSSSKEMLSGKAYQKENYVKIRWEWLAFPLALLILSLVFLVSTIMKTAGDGTVGFYKTSAMPNLIYGLPKETQGQFAASSTWASGHGAPKRTRAKLLPNLGWRISGQSHLGRSPRLPSGERVPHGWI